MVIDASESQIFERCLAQILKNALLCFLWRSKRPS